MNKGHSVSEILLENVKFLFKIHAKIFGFSELSDFRQRVFMIQFMLKNMGYLKYLLFKHPRIIQQSEIST